MFKVLFKHDSEVEDLFCGAFFGSKPTRFFSNNLCILGFEPVQDDFHQNCTWMTDEADNYVIQVELKVSLFREGSKQSATKSIGMVILLFSRSWYRSLSKHLPPV